MSSSDEQTLVELKTLTLGAQTMAATALEILSDRAAGPARSRGGVDETRKISVAEMDQIAAETDVPAWLLREVLSDLDYLATYRETVGCVRYLDLISSDCHRYLYEMLDGVGTSKTHDTMIRCVASLREFVHLARENGIDPIAVLRKLERRRPKDRR